MMMVDDREIPPTQCTSTRPSLLIALSVKREERECKNKNKSRFFSTSACMNRVMIMKKDGNPGGVP